MLPPSFLLGPVQIATVLVYLNDVEEGGETSFLLEASTGPPLVWLRLKCCVDSDGRLALPALPSFLFTHPAGCFSCCSPPAVPLNCPLYCRAREAWTACVLLTTRHATQASRCVEGGWWR